MKLNFVKYHGAGNDFVICDMREKYIELSEKQIAFLCDRRFGVGADGYMTLSSCVGADFYMKYYNSDGGESTMCGNGGRCIAMFAHRLGIGENLLKFNACDGEHSAQIIGENIVRLKMIDILTEQKCDNGWLIDTGSPHYVEIVDQVDEMNLIASALPIRQKYNCNVNYVQLTNKGIKIRTFERGVENETLACGTGATACAVITKENVVLVRGGQLEVQYVQTKKGYENVFLTGPAIKVFDGNIEI